MHSKYRYHGYLRRLPGSPDPEQLKHINQVVFSADSIEHWKCTDDPTEKEWVNVPARVNRIEEGVALRGHFEDIRRIDNLDHKTPRFWAPLSITSEEDPRFPLDCLQYPFLEITYRCATSHAGPACLWTYPGGAHLVQIEASRDWVTAGIPLQHRNFPKTISRFTLRLYGSWRSTEILEIAQVRFRALLPEEASALSSLYVELEKTTAPPQYPLLKEFLPFGVYMNSANVEQLADMMDISFFDYLRLAFEDIIRHHHNCVVMEGMQTLDLEERTVLVELAENFGLRLVPTYEWPMDNFDKTGDELIASYIKPHVDSNGILAWNVLDAPSEQGLQNFIKARDKIAAVDHNHPMAVHMHQADNFPLFSPFFAVSGFSHFGSGDPWSVGEALRTHLPLSKGGQFWLTAPTFVYASDAPDWCSSPQLRLMLNTTLANGGRGWLSYTYHNIPVWTDGRYDRSLTGPFLTFSDLWAELGNRVERLAGLSPLFLSASPIAPPPHLQLDVKFQRNPKTPLREDIDPISVFWLQGPEYFLFYVINNDTDQVTSVNLSLPESLPDGLEVYEITALVRNRAWEPSEHTRHFEMFPGQGRLFLVAQPPVCNEWREIIGHRMLQSDRRQAQVDLELARQYRLDLGDIEAALNNVDKHASIEELNRVRSAREQLFNLIYTTPEICEPHSLLVKASSVICGCDEGLASLYGRGKTEKVRELNVKVLPLARALTVLRLQLRRGHGQRISPEIAALVQSGTDLLSEIWNNR